MTLFSSPDFKVRGLQLRLRKLLHIVYGLLWEGGCRLNTSPRKYAIDHNIQYHRTIIFGT